MYFTRGQPVVYYGDEQGFTGDGGDQDARQDMFASKVASYNDDDLIGTTPTTADRTSTPTHPLYRYIADLVAAAGEEPDARRRRAGARATPTTAPGIYAFSRIVGAAERRVRRRGQQRRHDQDGDLPDVLPEHDLRLALADPGERARRAAV